MNFLPFSLSVRISWTCSLFFYEGDIIPTWEKKKSALSLFYILVHLTMEIIVNKYKFCIKKTTTSIYIKIYMWNKIYEVWNYSEIVHWKKTLWAGVKLRLINFVHSLKKICNSSVFTIEQLLLRKLHLSWQIIVLFKTS